MLHAPSRDVYIIAVMDSFISLFGGVVIFSVLGNMALELGVKVPDVVQSGKLLLNFPPTS